MAWTLAYKQTCNQYPNPTRLDFQIESNPIIINAKPIGQLNSYYRLGRISFLIELPGIGTTKGKSQVIHRGYQFVDSEQLPNYKFKSEFWIYGYVPQVELELYIFAGDIEYKGKQFLYLKESLERIEAAVNDSNEVSTTSSNQFDDSSNSSTLGII